MEASSTHTVETEEPETGTNDNGSHEDRAVPVDGGARSTAGASDGRARSTADTAEARVGETATALRRRQYIRALGGVGAAGVVGAASVTAASGQGAFDEAAADQRIQQNRTGPLTVEVVDGSGNAVSGASVSVEMQEHDFVFGTAIGGDQLINQTSDGHPYRENLLDLFNTAVLGNDHKWAFWEDNQQLADAAVDWLERHGFRIRGHTCVYGVDYAIPTDVQTAIENEDGQTVRDRSMQHVEEIITHYGDRIQEWDVVNEAMHRGLLQSAVYPDGIDLDDLPAGDVQPWQSQLLADWYSQAQSVIDENGLDVDVCTNDYNTMTWSYARSRYADQLTFLQNQGIDVDGIGLQGHIAAQMDGSDPWTYDRIDGVFDHYAQFDASVRITEFDMTGDGWSDQQQRADVMRQFLKTAFGHPNVDEFVIWGMWDETHWRDEAPFFEEDWTEKPALDVWRNLVQGEWWTSESGSTNASGAYSVDATLGTHQVTVTAGGTSVTREVEVTDPNAGTTVQVQVPDGGTLTLPDGSQPGDLNGDGVYRDVNGNGRLDSDDVVTYFDNVDSDTVQGNVDAFDYNENGRIDFDDVVTLFESL